MSDVSDALRRRNQEGNKNPPTDRNEKENLTPRKSNNAYKRKSNTRQNEIKAYSPGSTDELIGMQKISPQNLSLVLMKSLS